MFEHNADWHGEAGRCPLFLEELHDFDSTWPPDQEGCMQKLHRLVCLKKLKLLDLDVLNSSFTPVAAVHRRHDSTSDTLLRAKPDPSRSAEWRGGVGAAIECQRRSGLVVGAHRSQRLRLFEE